MPLILILDDRATNRAIFTRLAQLIADEVIVESFANPLDALEWLESNEVDLVITDYSMREMDGAEFTRRFRALRSGAAVPVLVVTAYDDRGFRQAAMEAGATDFLQSPVDHFEFVARARNLLALPPAAAAPRPVVAPAMDDLPALVLATDRDGRCLFVNARMAGHLGRPAAELVGQDMARVLGAERAALGRAKDRAVIETGQGIPAFWETAEGGLLLLTSKAPLRAADGAVVGVLSTSLELDPAAGLPGPLAGGG
ncbi:response regulator [Roseomonas nepalensis]|uniref:Response regulator n=1 Tax=Muricoccus nepalensis TaxID=1854500 RepID=A0A502GH28_9PROT|nr:response regulator [Roseomonas nepalensis]TPG61174.1 response regulator [Roseomonas nepalensis]